MKLVCMADTHITDKQHRCRKDDCVKTQFEKLGYILEYSERNADAILIAGDVFDSPRNWILLPKVMDIFSAYKIPKFCVVGQHDMYMYSREHLWATNLGILKKAGIVTVLSKNGYSIEGCNFFGMNWGEENIPVAPENHTNILLVHAPIAETTIYPGGEYIDVLKFGEECDRFDLVVCGDIHRRFNVKVKGTTLVNSGPLMRRTADVYNMEYEPGVWMYDTKTKETELVAIPHNVASQVIDRSSIEDVSENEERYKELISELSKVKLTDVNLRGNIMKGLKKASISLRAKDIVIDLINQ